MKNKTTIEEKIIELLEGYPEILFAYLFGSFIKQEKYNDIDIAFYISPDFDLKDLKSYPFGYESEITGKLNLALKTDKVDVVLLNKADLLMAIQIYNSGKLLFEKDRFLRIKIENSVRKEFIDTNHYRRRKSENLKRILNVR
jgi:hypothetical protein